MVTGVRVCDLLLGDVHPLKGMRTPEKRGAVRPIVE